MTMRVVATGHATVQDLGRAGFASFGVPVGGAADAWALRAGNRLCGNDDGAAALEIALGGITVTFDDDTTVAVVGAPSIVEIDGETVQLDRTFVVPAGAAARIGAGMEMAFTYLCVAGGLATPPVLDSRSTLAHAGIGRALHPRDSFPTGTPSPSGRMLRLNHPVSGCEPVARVIPGPHAERFAREASTELFHCQFTIGVRSDRVGRRLDGATLQHAGGAEIDPAGMVPGSIQVPPDGSPIVLGPDGPVTGGYPVIATIISADLACFMQTRPGRPVRFTETTVSDARAAWLERERHLDEYVRDA